MKNLLPIIKNYVNKLSMWTAYCFFCLACKIRVLLAVPHAHQPKESKYPKTRKLTFPDENVQFFCFGDASKY
ncbi:hypothetical protein COK37_02020 [Bacillus thuringiensis]|nr:hypothetical protein CN493_05730 [Bacillus thuringiensis]PEV47019.1 hypothetical protein CN432_16625 [Bacillus thuringiensis]PEZ38173.1 hypothetical protein CN346_06205 [Bacillus thuringiensis]PFF81209.1 hypothetical protein CN339_01395 [Bacillus thuringiensis]PFR71714.1 hypothetical protein COK37_02020 [Bacillus thuringiensis]